MSDELREQALRAGVYGFLEKRAGELKNQAREALRALPVGDVIAGKAGEQVLCKASWVSGRQKISVEDEAALLEWVKANHLSEVIESVNPAYVKSFKAVDGTVIDSGGEPVPGMVVEQGDGYITVKSTPETPFLVAQLLSGGRISLDVAKGIEQ